MKWFKHDTDASDDIKIRRLEEEYNNDGYATFFKILEIMGKEGEKGRLKLENYPKKWISTRCHISEEKLSDILCFMGSINLICPKSLKNNEIRIPNFLKRADDYTKRIRRLSEQDTENVPLEENRIEEIRIEENRIEEIKELLTKFSLKYKEKTGKTYIPSYAKDSTILKKLCMVINTEEMDDLMGRFFDSNDPFIEKAGYTIGVFKSMINKLRTPTKQYA